MQRLPKPISVRPSDGGWLITTQSAENVGAANFVERTNWRRINDVDGRREGTLPFKPNADQPENPQSVLPDPIVGIWEAIRPNGDRCIVAAARSVIYRFNYTTGVWDTIGTGFSPDAVKWEGEALDGYLFLNNGVDLVQSFRVEDSTVKPLKEMREIGIACVGTICVANGFLLCGDVTEIIGAELAPWMNGPTPFGIVPADKVNRIRYKIVWPDYNNATNWSPDIDGTINSSDKTKVILDYPISGFTVGVKVAVDGAGINGGTLGGETGFEDGVPITAVTGTTLTLGEAASNSNTFPLRVKVSRWSDISTFAGSSTIQDDSSAILRMILLKRVVIVYRETGIFSGRYTAVVETPWVFTPEYTGANVPAYPDAIINMQGDAHIYATKNRFYGFDGAGDPQPFKPLDNARTLFFNGLTPANAYKAFARHNPITRELWFFCPNGVLTYNYQYPSIDWIDESYDSAVYVRKPDGTASTDPSEYWFVMSKDALILQYGAIESGPITYLRGSAPVVNTLTSGAISLGDDLDEKDLHLYAILPASGANPVSVEVTLLGKDNIIQNFDVLFTEQLNNVAANPLIETFFRNVYFQDRIRVVATEDVNFLLAGRSFYYTPVRSLGVTRNANGHS